MSMFLSRSPVRLTAPYPGLRPFQPHEADIFFGRDEHVADMLTALEDHRFLAVVGPSGAGKSSLVLAGLIPALHRGMLLTAKSADWRVVVMRPGDAPFRNLAAGIRRDLIPAAASGHRAFHDGDARLTEVVLRVNPFGFLQTVLDAAIPDTANVMLVVDQFEELFRFRGLDVVAAASELAAERRNDATAFVQLLLASARQIRRPVHVMLTMRSDFLGECDMFEGLPQAINASQFLTPRLTFRQLEQAIVRPLTLDQFTGQVQPELVQRILNDMGSDRDQLPVVQHALFRTWQFARARAGDGPLELRLEDYEQVGGLRDALSRHCDEAFAELSQRGLARVVERVFRGLCALGPTGQRIRRPVKIGRLAQEAGAEPGQVECVAEAFRRPDRCFVVAAPADPLTPDSTVDISHESLIRHWRALHDPDRAGAGWIGKEEAAARRWRRLVESARIDQERGNVRDSSKPSSKLRDPELQRVLDWWNDDQPTPTWADRYEPDTYSLVRSFVDASRIERDWEAQRVEDLRREREEARLSAQRLVAERQRSRLFQKMLGAVGLVALAALAMFGVALSQKRVADQLRVDAERSAQDARDEKDRADRTALIAQAERTALLAGANAGGARRMLLAAEAVRLASDAGVRVLSAEQALLDAVPPQVLGGHGSSVVKVAASAAGRTTLAADLDGHVLQVRLPEEWPAGRAVPRSVPNASLPMVTTLDGRMLVIGGAPGTLAVLDLVSGGEPRAIRLAESGGKPGVAGVKLLAAGRRFAASGAFGGTVELHELATARSRVVGRLKGTVTALAISGDDRWVAGAAGRVLRVWHAGTLPPAVLDRSDQQHAITAVGFTSDMQWLVASDDAGKTLAWRVGRSGATGPPAILNDGTVPVTALAVAVTRPWVIAGARDGRVLVWNLSEGIPRQPLAMLLGHEQEILELVVDSADRRLLSIAADRTAVRIADLDGELRFQSRVLRDAGEGSGSTGGSFNTAAFLADRVVTGGTRWLLWELDRTELHAAAARLARRNLTDEEWRQFFLPQTPYHATFAGLPKPRSVADRFDRSIRYYVERLPAVPGSDARELVERAWESWTTYANVQVRPVATIDEANVVLTTASLDAYGGYGDAPIGPPDDVQLEVQFSSGGAWDADRFQAVACHNFGHILGLSHSRATGQIMSDTVTAGLKTPQSEDIRLVQERWGINSRGVAAATQGIAGLAKELVQRWQRDEPDSWVPQQAEPAQVSNALRLLADANLLRSEAAMPADAAWQERVVLAEDAARQFQRLAGLKPDGLLGKSTLARLDQFLVCQSTRDRNSPGVPLPVDSQAAVINSKLGGSALFIYVERLPAARDIDHARELVTAAAQLWTRPTRTSVTLVDSLDQANVVITTRPRSEASQSFGDADIGGRELLRGYRLRITLPTDTLHRTELVQSALVHHLGHVLGLEHTSSPGQAMSSLVDTQHPPQHPSDEDRQRCVELWYGEVMKR